MGIPSSLALFMTVFSKRPLAFYNSGISNNLADYTIVIILVMICFVRFFVYSYPLLPTSCFCWVPSISSYPEGPILTKSFHLSLICEEIFGLFHLLFSYLFGDGWEESFSSLSLFFGTPHSKRLYLSFSFCFSLPLIFTAVVRPPKTAIFVFYFSFFFGIVLILYLCV